MNPTKADPAEILSRPIAGMEFTRQQIDDAVREGRLLSLEVEMTHNCNLRCTYCYSSAGAPLANELSLAEIQHGIRQAVALGARKIVLLGGDEPCLYPHLRELIAFLYRLRARIEVFTNGTLLDRALARFLYEHGVSVVIKRNAEDEETQDALAGVPGAFARIQEGLAHLFEAGYPSAEHGLGAQTVICRQNLKQIPALWRWARDRRIQPYFECMTLQGRALTHKDLDVTVEEIRDIFRQLCAIDAEEYGVEWAPHPPLAGSACSRHRYSMLVKSNGRIYPCVGVELSLGDIRKDSLAEIIRTHPIVQDLRHVYKKIKGTCRICRHNGECYGCRGNAFQLTGDHLASDPCCWVKGE